MKDCGQNTRSLAVPVRAPMSGNTEEHKIAQRRRSSLVSYMRNKESNLVRRGRASEGTRIHFATRLQKLQISKPPHRTNAAAQFSSAKCREIWPEIAKSACSSTAVYYSTCTPLRPSTATATLPANICTFHAHCIEVSGTIEDRGWRLSHSHPGSLDSRNGG